MVAERYRIGQAVGASLDTEVVVVEDTALAQQRAQPVGIGVVVGVRTVLELLQGSRIVGCRQTVVLVGLVHQQGIVVGVEVLGQAGGALPAYIAVV